MNEFFIPQCNEPIILVNQNALRLIADGAELVLFGEKQRYGKYINEMSLHKFLDIARSKWTFDNPYVISDAYVMDGDEKVYFYQLVECGHCALCRHRRQIDMVNRATMEQLCYTTPPYFITLTYDNAHLPAYGELRYTDVQRFFKRLRRSWDRKGIKHDIRYIVSGEYGHKHGRPHYHILLFNNPYHCDETHPNHYKLWLDIYNAWSEYDFVNHRRVPMCSPAGFKVEQCAGGAPSYVTKYMCKDVSKCKHFFKPFVRTSIKNGGIGAPYLRKIAEWHRQNTASQKICFCMHDGSYKELTIGKYANRYLFPSPAAQVAPAVRADYRELQTVLAKLVATRSMKFDQAAYMAEALRPSPYIRNKFSMKMVKLQQVLRASSCKPDELVFVEMQRHGLLVTLDRLVEALSVRDDIDEKLIRIVKEHREKLPPQMSNFGSLGPAYFQALTRSSRQLATTIF